MILVIPYSHVDIDQAFRLIKWIGFLSERHGACMLKRSVLLVASQHACRRSVHRKICHMAAMIFGEARCFMLDRAHEVGWPGAANHMFKCALEHVESHFKDDIFLLEPDAVPVAEDWFEAILSEWNDARAQGKRFMGNLVPHHVDHMTGVAAYGAEWRQVAPSLVECPDKEAWDTYSAPQVLPHMRQTFAIQHVFRRHSKGWSVPSLDILDERAKIFHQDKRGKLIRMLDEVRFSSYCITDPLYAYGGSDGSERGMTKFYLADNASKGHKSHGKTFLFQGTEILGGAISGALMTDDLSDQAALDDLASDPSSGVRSVTKEEYEHATKKKVNAPTILRPSNELWPPLSITRTPSQSPAVLAAAPPAPTSPDKAQIANIDDVLKMQSVLPSNPFSRRGKSP